MPTGTTFNPVRTSDFDKTKLNFNAQGVSANIIASSVQNIDLTLADDCLMTGAWVVINGATQGDTLIFQVVDTTGFTGYPAGTVLNQFITNWYPNVNTDVQLDMVYPAKVIAGLTLRVVYTSIGTTNPFIAINYKLHKVLI
jgi:hypothetical protein